MSDDARPPELPRPYVSVSSLWKVVVGLLAVATAIDALAVWSGLAEYDLLSRIASREPFTLAEAVASDQRQRLIGILGLVAVIATAISFIMWTYRAYSNIPALLVEGLRFRRWWAIGGWFIPIWATFRPKQIVNDIWRGSDPDLPEGTEYNWQNAPVPWWWGVWWLAFLFSNQLYLAVTRMWLEGDESVEAVRNSSLVTIWADGLNAVAGILAILVVWTASRRQLERARRLNFV